MENEKKPSIIKEALLEFSEIQEIAIANAKKNLAEQYPEKFSNLLKEELNKNKKSYKKIDDNKESDMKNQTKVVKENAGKDGVFTEKPKLPDMVKEEREKDFMGDVEGDTPNKSNDKTKNGNAYVEKVTTKKETPANKTSIKEEFDITDLGSSSVGSALENADDDDEIITMDEIELEIDDMDSLEEELDGIDMGEFPQPTLEPRGSASGQEGDAYDKLVKMKEELDEIIGGFDEQKNNGGQGANKINIGGPTQSMVDEEEITDDDVESVLGSPTMDDDDDEEVDEAHGVTYGSRRNNTGRHIPTPDYLSQGELDQSPEYVRESKKKISGLINENKNLTKKLNETKKYKQSVTTLVEQYKSALEKYRNQLKEMATFNTNLAHVNNLLVNESLALTQEDKVKIINEFKKVSTIGESQLKYKSILSEMKRSKPTLTENFEKRVNASVSPSSKQKLDEVIEVTAYENDKHINRMKELIEYVENKGSKKII